MSDGRTGTEPSRQYIATRDYELVRQALLRRHDLDPDGFFDAETDSALIALEALYKRARAE